MMMHAEDEHGVGDYDNDGELILQEEAQQLVAEVIAVKHFYLQINNTHADNRCLDVCLV